MVRYTTIDYLRDSYGFLDDLFIFSEKIRVINGRLWDKIIKFEYDTLIFNAVDNIPYAMAIIFLGFFAAFTLFKFSESKGGMRISTITTGSMNPAIAPGSIIVSNPQANYKKGDIVSYKELNASTGYPTGRVVTHRVVKVEKKDESDVYITKGDSNSYPDPGEVKAENVFGKVFLVLPYFGYLDVIVRSIPGFIILIALPSLIIIKNELAYIRRHIN